MDMTSSSRLLLSIIVTIFMLHLISPTIKAQLESCTERAEFCWNCSYIGEFTNTSNYKQNLHNLLSSFSSSATSNTYGFYNYSSGENSDKVNAIALCRVDVVLDECRNCIEEISTMILQKCPNQKEAILWGERCMVRYSNNTIFAIKQDSPIRLLPSPHYSTNTQQYKLVLDPLLVELSTKAAKGNSTTKFAYSSTRVSASDEPIFALLQCTPDLNDDDCNSCLENSISRIPDCCGGKTGARVLKPSCTLRFEKERFYNFLDSPNDIGPQPVPQGGKGSNTKRTVIIIVIPVIISVILLIIVFSFCKMRKLQKKLEIEAPDEMTSMESLQFDLGTVEAATNNFSEANKLGEGGFGAVYKGRLANGQSIAVKRLSVTSGQGDLEFKNEVMLVAKLQHRNLVRLLGFCLEGSERLLVYEFVPNASLNQFIFDPVKRRYLDWDMRYKIIGGIARGLVYLHEDSRLKIIHRDLKTSNILLDKEMNSKISDFGMARLFVVDQTQQNTSRIVGTFGYMAPEYAMQGHFSVKSDVYSFGVLLLEIVSGQKNYYLNQVGNVQDLLSHAWKNWTDGTALNIVDPTLQLRDDEGSRSEIMKCIHIALLCVQENPAERPTMNSVVVMLTSYSDITLPVPSQPRLFEYNSDTGSGMFSLASEHNSKETKLNTSESNSVKKASINEDSISGPYPR